jgi:hypothetical protein
VGGHGPLLLGDPSPCPCVSLTVSWHCGEGGTSSNHIQIHDVYITCGEAWAGLGGRGVLRTTPSTAPRLLTTQPKPSST